MTGFSGEKAWRLTSTRLISRLLRREERHIRSSLGRIIGVLRGEEGEKGVTVGVVENWLTGAISRGDGLVDLRWW